DPQGFLREWNKSTKIITQKNILDIDIYGITGIKTDQAELSAFTNGVLSLEGMKFLKKKFNLEFVILTNLNQVMLLHKDILYSVSLKKFENSDFVGLGDILTTGFSCSYIKEQDPLWALCFGVGAVISSLMSGNKGLEKVPKKMSSIEKNASYLYNTVKFRIVD
ncbi:MAG: ribokinase, partial [Thermoproteota archaeon]|nr:ribokinase [Thermoproteota archaeon]